MQCHTASGSASHTRLILQAGSQHRSANLAAFDRFVNQISGGATLLLDKASGNASHVGGTQLAAGSTDHQAFSDFIDLLVAEASGSPQPGPEPDPTPEPEPEPEPEPDPSAPPPQTAAEHQYADEVEAPVVQARCVSCHVAGGPAAQTPLLFTAGDALWADNFAAFEAYLQLSLIHI